VGAFVTGVTGVAKGSTKLASLGVKLTKTELDKMAKLTTLAKPSAGLGGIVSLEESGMLWGQGIGKQGKPFEAFVQGKLPEGTKDLNAIKGNFKVFDHYHPETGIATSTKTLDTASKTYQNPANINRQLNKYVDDMVKFPGDGKGDFVITNSDISSKQMQLGIPHHATPAQLQAISQSIEYGRSQGITIIVTKVK
jgi:filamentous hemagglutinin